MATTITKGRTIMTLKEMDARDRVYYAAKNYAYKLELANDLGGMGGSDVLLKDAYFGLVDVIRNASSVDIARAVKMAQYEVRDAIRMIWNRI